MWTDSEHGLNDQTHHSGVHTLLQQWNETLDENVNP